MTTILCVGSKSLLRLLVSGLMPRYRSELAVVTVDDRDDPRSAFDEIATECRVGNVPLTILERPRELATAFEHHRPAIVLVACWYWLIPDDLIAAAPRGVLGIHHSLLPTYRGSAPLVWAMIHGEAKVGTSIFRLASGMDDGPLYAQIPQTIGEDQAVGEVLEKLNESATGWLSAHLGEILDGALTPVDQDLSSSSFCAARRPDDGLIDWTGSAKDIHNFVRAQSDPYPGAFSFLSGSKVTLWRTRRVEYAVHGRAGSLWKGSGMGTWAITGHGGAIELLEVGVEGTRLDPQELLEVGSRFELKGPDVRGDSPSSDDAEGSRPPPSASKLRGSHLGTSGTT